MAIYKITTKTSTYNYYLVDASSSSEAVRKWYDYEGTALQFPLEELDTEEVLDSTIYSRESNE